MIKKIIAILIVALSLIFAVCASVVVYITDTQSVISYKDTELITEKEPVVHGSDDKAFVFPEEMIPEQARFDWYLSGKTLMYNKDNSTIFVNEEEVPLFEKDGWFKEPVALISKGKETKYVVQSELELHRQSGWQILRYGPALSPLVKQLEAYIKGKSGKYGIYIKNLTNGNRLIINDGPYSAASIMKLFVMTGVYSEIAGGRVIKTPAISGKLNSMITVSDNYSSNYLVRIMGKGNYKAGFDTENAMTKSMGCMNTVHKSLYVGYGDYVSYGRNTVSPVDCGIVLEKIYKGTLISPEYSEEMLKMLKSQQRRNKIPYLLPKGTVCANKTGETSSVQSDIGIVYSPGADYIICVLTNNSASGISDIQRISRMVYDYFN